MNNLSGKGDQQSIHICHLRRKPLAINKLFIATQAGWDRID
jgi:hypothetical protein